MFKIIDTQNNHLPVKAGFLTAAQAYKWAKKNLPKESCSEWGKMNYKRRDRYYIIGALHMLVEFRQAFVIQGTNVIKKRKYFWSRPEEITQNICCTTSIYGICDEKDLDSEIKRLTEKELKSSGWGYKFSGWQRVVPRDECIELYREHGWDLDAIPTYEIKITPITSWKMNKILETLTGEQFAQFCRENNVAMRE